MGAGVGADPQEPTAVDFDISIAELEDPYDLWKETRADHPVFYSREFGLWVITRYADVEEVLRQPDLFSSARSFDPSRPLPESVAVVVAEPAEHD